MEIQRNRSGIVRNVFVGEGHFDLHLRINELIALQEILNVGPFALSTRFAQGEWLVNDVKETIRLGLIGGGLSQREAFAIVERNVTAGYLMEYAMIAHQCILAAVMGVEDEPIEDESDSGEVNAPTE